MFDVGDRCRLMCRWVTLVLSSGQRVGTVWQLFVCDLPVCGGPGSIGA